MNHQKIISLPVQTDEEFQKVYLTYRPGNKGEREEHKIFESLDDLPLVLDWRTRGAVSQVKEQVDIYSLPYLLLSPNSILISCITHA